MDRIKARADPNKQKLILNEIPERKMCKVFHESENSLPIVKISNCHTQWLTFLLSNVMRYLSILRS
jgi:hypothetical protein